MRFEQNPSIPIDTHSFVTAMKSLPVWWRT
jgi:hypothetical protein